MFPLQIWRKDTLFLADMQEYAIFSTELAGHTLLDGGKQCVSIVAAHALNRLEQGIRHFDRS